MAEENSGIFSMISGFVDNSDQAWKHLVCPYKHKYALESLGPHIQCWNNTTYRRQDENFRNSLGNQIEYTLFFNDEKTPETDFFLIYLHTHGGCRLEGYHMLRHCGKFGFGLCILDFSGSGHSEGDFISLGHFEQHDLVQLTSILQEKHGITNYAVWGRSMGASTAMLAYPNISPFVMILDSPFTSVNRVYRCAVKKHISLPNFMIDMVYAFAAKEVKKRFNFDIDAITPFDNGSKIRVPTVLIGTPEDQITEYSELLELYEIIQLPGIQKVIVQCQGSHTDDRDEQTLDSSMQFIVDVFRSIRTKLLPKRPRGLLQSNSFSNIHSMKNQINMALHQQSEARPVNAVPNISGNHFHHHHTVDNSRFVGGHDPANHEKRDGDGMEWVVNQEPKNQSEQLYMRRPADLSISQNISVASKPTENTLGESQMGRPVNDSSHFDGRQTPGDTNHDHANQHQPSTDSLPKGEIASRINLKKNLGAHRRPDINFRGRREIPSSNREHHSMVRNFTQGPDLDDEYTPGGRSRLKAPQNQGMHLPPALPDRDPNHPAKERATSLKRNNFITQNRIGLTKLSSKLGSSNSNLEHGIFMRNGSIVQEDQLPQHVKVPEPIFQENTPVQQHNHQTFVHNVSEFALEQPSRNSVTREIFPTNVFEKQTHLEKPMEQSPRLRPFEPHRISSNTPFQTKSTNYRPLLLATKKEFAPTPEHHNKQNESLMYNRSYQNYTLESKPSPVEAPRSMMHGTHRAMPYYVQPPAQAFAYNPPPVAPGLSNSSFQDANTSRRREQEKLTDPNSSYNKGYQTFHGQPAFQPQAQRRSDLKQRGNFIDFNRYK
jgi:hypothetical protein